jgi:hypothetical protein
MARRFTQKKKGGYRGSLGGAPMRGAFTTGAQQELKQMGGVSRATQKFMKKALKAQQNAANAASAASKKAANNAAAAKKAANNAAAASKKAANNAAAASKKAANNAQRAKNAAARLKAKNDEIVKDLVQRLEKHQRSIAPFSSKLTNAQRAHMLQQEHNKQLNINMGEMVNDLVGKIKTTHS